MQHPSAPRSHELILAAGSSFISCRGEAGGRVARWLSSHGFQIHRVHGHAVDGVDHTAGNLKSGLGHPGLVVPGCNKRGDVGGASMACPSQVGDRKPPGPSRHHSPRAV